jgi:hypothetical protein
MRAPTTGCEVRNTVLPINLLLVESELLTVHLGVPSMPNLKQFYNSDSEPVTDLSIYLYNLYTITVLQGTTKE